MKCLTLIFSSPQKSFQSSCLRAINRLRHDQEGKFSLLLKPFTTHIVISLDAFIISWCSKQNYIICSEKLNRGKFLPIILREKELQYYKYYWMPSNNFKCIITFNLYRNVIVSPSIKYIIINFSPVPHNCDPSSNHHWKYSTNFIFYFFYIKKLLWTMNVNGVSVCRTENHLIYIINTYLCSK
jgi:hypothetical protein